MSIARSLLKNTGARLVAEIINRAGAALFWVFVARYLGVSSLGALAFALSMFSFFLTVSTLGLGAVLIRDVARDRSKAGAYFGHALMLGSGLALAAAMIMIVLVQVLQSSGDMKSVSMLMALAVLPASLFYWSKSLLSAAERMPDIAVARLAENIFKVTVGIALLVRGGDVFVMALVILGSKVISAVIAFLFARRIATPLWRLDMDLIRYCGRMTPAFSGIALANSLFWVAPVVILTRFAGEYQAGLYSAAYKLVDIVVSFALAYGQAMFPVAARTLVSGNVFKSLINKSVRYSIMLTLPVAAGMALLSNHIVFTVYGAGMAGGAGVLKVLIWMIVPFSMVPVLAFALLGSFQQKYDLLANTAAALTVICLGIILTPQYGAMGAACSVLCGSTVFLLVEIISVQRTTCSINIVSGLWKPVLGIILMTSVFYLLRETNLIINITLAGATYILVLMLSKAITINKLLMMKHLKSA